jgi:hypothetical protein
MNILTTVWIETVKWKSLFIAVWSHALTVKGGTIGIFKLFLTGKSKVCLTGNTKNSSLTITVEAHFLLAGHNIYKIFDKNINSGYVYIWKNTHKIITCLSYGTHHLLNICSTNLISEPVITCDFHHVHFIIQNMNFPKQRRKG